MYKLHMFAFTKRVTKDLSTVPFVADLEVVPESALGGLLLRHAVPYEQHEAEVNAAREKAEQEAREEAERLALEAEERKKRELEEAYEQSMPDEIERKVKAVIDREMGRMKEEMEGKYNEEHAQLRKQLEALKA